MTVAAMEAEALDAALATRPGAPRGFVRDLQRRIAALVALPWALATSEDCKYRSVTGVRLGLGARLRQAYAARVMRVTTYDARVRAVWIEVFTMLRPPTRILWPDVLLRVLRDALTPAPRSKANMKDRMWHAGSGRAATG
jgi:hypothetical protein